MLLFSKNNDIRINGCPWEIAKILHIPLQCYGIWGRMWLCVHCVAKKLHYRVARCAKNIQNTERVKRDLRNIFDVIIIL